ncbi:MAG: phenylalanine--tRNA ligase subunit beta [candidate division Zixibacteria bacterium RBG_16_53_22]|nr:MAG: phenylalanine--tRNA ligase subunit beta [candidate division Zixibacteria bacterium RBG_16_53_22]
MKISLNLLRTLIDCDWPYEKIADKLTMSGSEVEAIERRGYEISGVISARIDSVTAIDGSDRLSKCEVQTGKKNLQVVCGAPNVAKGQNVLFAPIGARLPGGVNIEKAEIHGVESFGMVLSEAELDLSPESDIISVLPPDIKPGTPLDKIVNYRDIIFELEITPNRPDCLSHIGIAVELQALGGGRAHLPDINIREINEPTSGAVAVEIEDPVGCPRYTARVIRNVSVKPSPLWLKIMVHYLGMRPINNVVDITNIAMMELGQPLHAFDYDKFSNPLVVVRRARRDEKFVTLDNIERSLNAEHLLITDGARGVAIAGIMGGLDSEVSDRTSVVLLESAYFDPVTIRRGSKSLGLSSESSRRFERGANPEMAPFANHRASEAISGIAGGQPLLDIVESYPRAFAPVNIELRPSRVEQLLGVKIEDNEIARILSDLHISYTLDANFVVIQPSFRPDLTREVDLIEEIARIHGFDGIPASFRPGGSLVTPETKYQRIREKTRDYLVGAGLMEIFPVTLGDIRLSSKLGQLESSVRLMNPLSEEMAVVRPDLFLTMFPVIRRNLNFREPNLALFEIGDVYNPDGKGQLPRQCSYLGIALCGMEFPDFWGAKWRARDIFSLKGLIEDLVSHLQLGKIELVCSDHFVFEKGYSFDVNISGRPAGRMGRISKSVAESVDIKEQVYIAQLDFENLVELTPETITARELARYPSADRDIAIVLNEDIPARTIEDEISKAAGSLLDEVWVFDLYRGKGIPNGKKSLAFGMKFRLADRTLTDEEVGQALEKIVSALKVRFGAELRA